MVSGIAAEGLNKAQGGFVNKSNITRKFDS